MNGKSLQEVILELSLCVFLTFPFLPLPTVLSVYSSCTAIINLPLSLFPDIFHPA